MYWEKANTIMRKNNKTAVCKLLFLNQLINDWETIPGKDVEIFV